MMKEHDEHDILPEFEDRYVTNRDLAHVVIQIGDRMERRVGDVKLWLVGAVIANQTLYQLDLAKTIGEPAAFGIGFGTVLAIILKTVVFSR